MSIKVSKKAIEEHYGRDSIIQISERMSAKFGLSLNPLFHNKGTNGLNWKGYQCIARNGEPYLLVWGNRSFPKSTITVVEGIDCDDVLDFLDICNAGYYRKAGICSITGTAIIINNARVTEGYYSPEEIAASYAVSKSLDRNKAISVLAELAAAEACFDWHKTKAIVDIFLQKNKMSHFLDESLLIRCKV